MEVLVHSSISFRRTMRRTCQLLLGSLLLGCSLLISTAHAQRNKPEVLKPEPKGFTLQYALTGLAMGLGVYAAIRPGNRDTKVKQDRPDEE